MREREESRLSSAVDEVQEWDILTIFGDLGKILCRGMMQSQLGLRRLIWIHMEVRVESQRTESFVIQGRDA